MTLPILTYPDKRLFVKSKKVSEFTPELAILLDNMYETMIASGGIGLAAIQVGEPIRALVINLVNEDKVQDKNDLLEIINPEFTLKSGEIVYEEGCLSVPGYYENVRRAENIEIKYFDRFGKEQTLSASGLLAVAIQHECDHLDGHLFIEKIAYAARKKFDKEFRKNLKQKNSKHKA